MLNHCRNNIFHCQTNDIIHALDTNPNKSGTNTNKLLPYYYAPILIFQLGVQDVSFPANAAKLPILGHHMRDAKLYTVQYSS